jgi:hypothetical protein
LGRHIKISIFLDISRFSFVYLIEDLQTGQGRKFSPVFFFVERIFVKSAEGGKN